MKRNTLRVIAGSLRSRIISFPDTEGLRPTSDRIRETLFNWLRDDIRSKFCLDLFAGSGALGIEALSRGAAQVVFVESNPLAANAIEENLRLFEVDNAVVKNTDALQYLDSINNNPEKFDAVFLDPPFMQSDIYNICSRLDAADKLNPGCKVYVESVISLEDQSMPSEWAVLKQKKAGQVYFYLYQCKQ